MKRSFALVIGIFLAGLLTIMALVAWNLSGFKATIESDNKVAAGFYRMSITASRTVLGIVADVEKLFQSRTKQALGAGFEEIDAAFASLDELVAEMTNDTYRDLLAAPIVKFEAQAAAAEESPAAAAATPDQVSGEAAPPEPENLADLVALLSAGLDEARSAYKDVRQLADAKVSMAVNLAPLRNELNKSLRDNLHLTSIDPQSFNFLARGAITVLYTDSNRDVKFAGEAQFTKGYERLAKALLSTEEREGLEALKAKFDETYALARVQVASSSDSGFFNRQAEVLVDTILALERQVQHQFNQRQASLASQSAATMYLVLSIGALIAAISIAVSIFFAVRVTRRIDSVVKDLDIIAEGDLTKKVDASGSDEIAALASAFNGFVTRIRQTIVEVKEAYLPLSQRIEEMKIASEQTSEGMKQQRQATEMVATAMSEMATAVGEVSRNAAQASNAAQQAETHTEDGQQVINQTMEIINRLAEQVEQSGAVINKVEQESGNIGVVVDVIKGIAEQTNLLALNAAIEAARAGEQGRGFAVVADEVRTLASRTQSSTEEIITIIRQLQLSARKAVEVMGTAREHAEKGVDHSNRTGGSLSSIAQAVSQINDMNAQMATATEEQSAVTGEMNQNVVTISELTRQTSNAAESTKNASVEANQHMQAAAKALNRFKV